MDTSTRARLLEEAKNYKYFELEKFIADTGWEDWMNEYTDSEQILESEIEKIDEVLKEIFDEAHEVNVR